VQKSDDAGKSEGVQGPQAYITVKYHKGNLIATLTDTKKINATSGKVYAKSHILPDVLDAKMMTEPQGKFSAYMKTEELKAKENLNFLTAMSVSIWGKGQ